MKHSYLLLALLLMSFNSHAEKLTFGIFPYFSPAKLLKIHKPVIDHLSSALNTTITPTSANGFGAFIKNTKKKKYDIIMTAPHMGALAILQSGYQPLAVSSNNSHTVFISLKSSKFKDLKHLDGANITLPPEKAIISKLAFDVLKQNGHNIDDLDITHTKTHDNAMQSVLKGDADIAGFGLPTWTRYNKANKSSLQVIATSQNIPGFMVLANPNLDKATVNKASKALIDFVNSIKGIAYFRDSKLKSFRAITPEDVNELAPFVEQIFKFKK